MGGGKNALSILLLLIISYNSDAQTGGNETPGRWYFGVQGGADMGQCTFRSITKDNSNLGAEAGIFGGYGFNSVISAEAAVNYGAFKMTAQTCDPFWLSEDGNLYFAPVIDQNGEFYSNITAKTKIFKAAIQFNFDILKLFTEPCSKISLYLSPQISIVGTNNKLTSQNYNLHPDTQTHLGYGAQAAFGFFVSRKVQIQIFGGITGLGGDRFDNIPKHHHDSNLIMDGGIKIAYRSGRTCGQKPAEPYTDITTPEIDTTTQVVDIPVVDTTQNVVAVDTVKESIPDTPVVEDNKPIITSALSTIFFADNGITISPKETPKFREVVLYLKDHPDTKISIYGYCSKSGTDEYNKYLSQRRAELIKRRLMQQGVTEDRFKNVVGKGIDHATPDNKSARRVEIVVED